MVGEPSASGNDHVVFFRGIQVDARGFSPSGRVFLGFSSLTDADVLKLVKEMHPLRIRRRGKLAKPGDFSKLGGKEGDV